MHWKDWLKRKNAKLTLAIVAQMNKLISYKMISEFFKIKGITPPSASECIKEDLRFEGIPIPTSMMQFPPIDGSGPSLEEQHVKEGISKIPSNESQPSLEEEKSRAISRAAYEAHVNPSPQKQATASPKKRKVSKKRRKTSEKTKKNEK